MNERDDEPRVSLFAASFAVLIVTIMARACSPPADGEAWRPASTLSTGRVTLSIGPLDPSPVPTPAQPQHARAWVSSVSPSSVGVRVGYPGVRDLKLGTWCRRTERCPTGSTCWVAREQPRALPGAVGGRVLEASLYPGCRVGLSWSMQGTLRYWSATFDVVEVPLEPLPELAGWPPERSNEE